jgi:hypothetical protein
MVPEVDNQPPADRFEDPRVPSGRPGSRAPHILVSREGEEVSTIDLFADRWVLLHGPKGSAWRTLLAGSPAGAAVRAVCHGIEPAGDLQDINGHWATKYRLDDEGAVLIRPDGFVAWRRQVATGDAGAALDAAFGHVLALNGHS